MQLLYINADFDENGLETKIYDSIESFVQDRIGIAYSLLELEAFASEEDEDEEYLDEVFVLNLLKNGSHEGEWSTEEVWLIEDGGQFRNFRFAPGSVYTDIPRKVFCNNRSGIDVDFNTLILQITDIGGHLIRKIRTGGNGNGV